MAEIMKDKNGRKLALGDWVKVTPPIFKSDLMGHLWTEKAKPGIELKEPPGIGTVVARVCSMRVTDDGLIVPGKIMVTWMAQFSGSQRQEAVDSNTVVKLLECDGSEVG